MEEVAGSNPAEGTKTCSSCEIDKPVSHFAMRTDRQRLWGICSPCRASYQRDWYWRNRDQRIARQRGANKETKLRNKEHVRQYLAAHPCVDCGETDPIVLQFDHVRGTKRDDVSRMVAQAFSLVSIVAEIAKCEVRCANCHLRVTYARRRRA